jgi:phage FluMu protein Com
MTEKVKCPTCEELCEVAPYKEDAHYGTVFIASCPDHGPSYFVRCPYCQRLCKIVPYDETGAVIASCPDYGMLFFEEPERIRDCTR